MCNVAYRVILYVSCHVNKKGICVCKHPDWCKASITEVLCSMCFFTQEFSCLTKSFVFRYVSTVLSSFIPVGKSFCCSALLSIRVTVPSICIESGYACSTVDLRLVASNLKLQGK